MTEFNNLAIPFLGSILHQAFDKTCDGFKMPIEDRQEKYAIFKGELERCGYDTSLWPDVYPKEVE